MTATPPIIENPFNITQTMDRVAKNNEGLYLTREQKYVLLDYIAWNVAVTLLVVHTPYDYGKIIAQYGDGTEFSAGGVDSDAMTGLRELRTHIVRRGAQASRADAEYVLHLLPAGRWASDLCDWIAPPDEDYRPLEPLADVLAMAAALAMITQPTGPDSLKRIRQYALAAAKLVHAA
jgi:hypothetical protein